MIDHVIYEREIQRIKRLAQCRRCGAGDPLVPATLVTLIGQYKTRLCPPCQNDWDRYARNVKEFHFYRSIEVSIECEKMRIAFDGDPADVRENRIVTWVEQLEANRHKLFDIAETWVALGVPPPPKEKE